MPSPGATRPPADGRGRMLTERGIVQPRRCPAPDRSEGVGLVLLPSAASPSNELSRGGPMKRILISAIAIAVLIAGCGSGGSTTPAASKPKTTTSKTTTTTHTKPKPRKRRHVVKKRTTHTTSTPSGGGAVTTTTTTAAPPPPTTTTVAPPPPPTTTAAPPPVTTHQQPPPHHHHHSGGHGGYCLSVTDRIATPSGSVPVAQIQPGMHVWSTDAQGRRIDVTVEEVHHTAVPADHLMVRLHLADGRTVLASLGHPLPNGDPISSLTVGQQFEGTSVVSDTRVVYGQPDTYDILPAGPTHTYYADGVLLGSTLALPAGMYSHLF